MYNERMIRLGSNRSVIRELFEYGKKMAREVGAENVFDFSLGNPNVPAPQEVTEALDALIHVSDTTTVHGYTSAQGDALVRKAIADHINARFDAGMDPDLIYMTVGAAASLSVTLAALNEGADEFVVFAPFFPEYRVFIENTGGKTVVVEAGDKMSLNLSAFEKALSKNTKGVIINSPNNPSGAVYTEAQIKELCAILVDKEKEFGHPIFLISDEPYREIVYGNVVVPYIPDHYADAIVCYSYSKSLSLPGERIGYIAVSPRCVDSQNLYYAICGAGRSLGYVCAPSLFQKVIARCVDVQSDVAAYKRNRDLLLSALTEYGYDYVMPDGAFYLFVKALEEDANKFSDEAKKLGLLLVPSDSFGVKGYVRMSYCVSYDMIRRSLPKFKELAARYGL